MKWKTVTIFFFSMMYLVMACRTIEVRTNENLAIATMKAIKIAEQTYKEKNKFGQYGVLADLVNAQLLPDSLKDGRDKGYIFRIIIENNTYKAIAIPEKYTPTTQNGTGRISLFLDQSGIIRMGYKDGNEATVEDEPLSNKYQ